MADIHRWSCCET